MYSLVILGLRKHNALWTYDVKRWRHWHN